MAEISPAGYRAGEGEPLLLLHGITATWRCWLPVLPELVAHYDVWAPTLAGHDGGPPLPDGLEGLHTVTNFLESQLDEAGIETAHIAGNSLGGALALELAKRGRARSVVALSPASGWRHDDREEGERIIRYFKRQRFAAQKSSRFLPVLFRSAVARRLGFRDVMRRGEQVSQAEAVALARSSINCPAVDRAFESIRAGHGVIADLDQVSCPTLVAWGVHDRLLRMKKHSARFREEIPGVEFRELKGVGHMPMWDDPSLVTRTVLDWVQRHEAAPSRPAQPAAA